MIGFGVRKLLSRFSKSRIENQMDDEIRFHLEMATRENLAKGMSGVEARRAALLDFGGEVQTRETVRDVYATFVDSLLQDVRFAVRVFSRNRVFTLAAIITLALGISAATSIFSVVDATLLRPLPYNQPDRLVRIMGWIPEKGGYYEAVPGDYYSAFRTTQSFESVSSYEWLPFSMTLFNPTGAEDIRSARVSPNILRTLRTHVLYGREFSQDEGVSGNSQVVLLTYRSWQRKFGGDLKVIGQGLSFEEGPRTIAGVLPPDFRYPSLRSAWEPELLSAEKVDWGASPSDTIYFLLARLKPGAKMDAAQAEIDLISGRVNSSLPQNQRRQFRILPLQEQLTKGKRTELLLLFWTAISLLIICCFNVSNLLLAKGLARSHEMGVRAALGAGRARLARQLLTEGLLLSLAGGIVGVLLSYWMLPLILAQFPTSLRLGLNNVEIDGRVLLFSVGLTIVATAIHSLWPVLSASRTDIVGFLKKDDSRARGSGRDGFKPVLLIAQSALAMVLLVSAGLLINTFVRLETLSVGFKTDNLGWVGYYLGENRYPSIQSVLDFNRNLRDRVSKIPGVIEVAATDHMPLTGPASTSVGIPGLSVAQNIDLRHVTAGYFSVIGMNCVSGDVFTSHDELSFPRVAVINQTMARRYWPARSPLGETIVVDKDRPVQVIGIVNDVRERSPQDEPQPSIYVPLGSLSYQRVRSLQLLIRTATDDSAVYNAIVDQTKAADIHLAVEVRKYNEFLQFRSPRFFALLFGTCSAFGLALVGIGIAGITAYSVAQRTFEIGMRLALGAEPHQIVLMFVRRSVLAVGGGLLIGAAAALLLTRILAGLLFKITATDPFTFGVSFLLFLAVALLAAYVPARMAARVDPIVALRREA